MDDMSRLNRIEDFWNWLPAFRAVAETEHVGEASDKVHKSPSALSRSVSLLEDDFDVELFERDGREIQLTDAGREFLDVVRKSMRLVDEGLRRVAESDSSRDFRVAATRRLGWMVESTAGALATSLKNVDLHLETVACGDPTESLLQGELDLLVTHQPNDAENVATELLCELENAIFGPADHPFFERDDASPSDFDFVAPDSDSTGVPPDGWRRTKCRSIPCRADRPRTAARTAASADLLTILPKRFTEVVDSAMVPGASDDTPPLLETPVFAARRPALVDDDLASRALDELASRFPFRPSESGGDPG